MITPQKYRKATTGFVLPTATLVLIVMALLVSAIVFRSLSRTTQVAGEREQKVIANAASPAIERAKAKLEYLFREDRRLPSGLASDDDLVSMLVNDGSTRPQADVDNATGGNQSPYILPDETPLDLNNDGKEDTAWSFWVDTNSDNVLDTKIAYSILVRNRQGNVSRESSDAEKAAQLVVRNGPAELSGSNVNPDCNEAALAVEAGWDALNGATVGKAFQVTAIVIRDAANGDSAVNTASRTVATLELQQDRQANRVNKWGAWFRNDLEIFPGPDFRWNGAMHTEGNLVIGDNTDKFQAFLISSPKSCLYSKDASVVTIGEIPDTDPVRPKFQGQLINGSLKTNSYNGGSKFHTFTQTGTPPVRDVRVESDSVNSPANVNPGDLSLDPVVLWTTNNNLSRYAADPHNTTVRATDWTDRDVVKDGRVFNQAQATPYLDDTYRADNRYGPKAGYTNSVGLNRDPATNQNRNRVGDEIQAAGANADPNFNELTATIPTNPNDPQSYGLDGYWERRARGQGLRVIAGQRLELGNTYGWQTPQSINADGDFDDLIGTNNEVSGDPLNPTLTNLTTTNATLDRRHELRQWRTLRDNLAAVQATAVYHYNPDGDLGTNNIAESDFPIACLSSTAHPGTQQSITNSTTFNSTPAGTLNADFFTGNGTNGWEFNSAPGALAGAGAVTTEAGFADLFTVNRPLRLALDNLAHFAGDPFGAFPARQDTAAAPAVASMGAQVHPYPTLSMWGDFSNLRQVMQRLDGGTRYTDLSVAGKSTLHTATCTLGMLAYQSQRFDYAANQAAISSVAANNDIDDIFLLLGNGNKNDGEVRVLLTEDLDGDGILDTGEDLNGNGLLDGEDRNGNGVLDVGEDLNGNGRLDLVSEDKNRNGVLNAGEDLNGNGRLDTEDLNNNGVLDPGEDLNGSNTIDPVYFVNVTVFRFDRDNPPNPAPISRRVASPGARPSPEEFLLGVQNLSNGSNVAPNNTVNLQANSRLLQLIRQKEQIQRDRRFGFALTPTTPNTYRYDILFQAAPGFRYSGATYGAAAGINRLNLGCDFSLLTGNNFFGFGNPDLAAAADRPAAEQRFIRLAIALCDAHPTQQQVQPKYPSLFYLFPVVNHFHDGVATPQALITRPTTATVNQPNEDINRNGALDAGEDANGNNRLDVEPYIADRYIFNNAVTDDVNEGFAYRVVQDTDNNGVENGVENGIGAIAIQPRRRDLLCGAGGWCLPSIESITGTPPANSANTINDSFTNAPNTRILRIPLLDKGMMNGRETMGVRVIDMDLDLLRSSPVNRNNVNGETWFPYSGIIYAFREDAMREDAIARPASTNSTNCDTAAEIVGNTCRMNAIGNAPQDPPVNGLNSNGTWAVGATGISPKPVDFYPDPDRRPYGFRLRNGADLRRVPTPPADFVLNGMSFVSDNPVYIYGDQQSFNLHNNATGGTRIEEFTNLLEADWSDFYSRGTAGTAADKLNPNFARVGDTWRPVEVIADAVSILSDAFRDGNIAEGIRKSNTTAVNTSYRNFNGADNSDLTWVREDGSASNDVTNNIPIKISRNGFPLYCINTTNGNNFGTNNSNCVANGGREQEYGRERQTTLPGGITVNSGNNRTYTGLNTRTTVTATANTRINLTMVSGTVPSRAGQSYGGLHNFPRFLENWGGGNLFISGSFVQLNFSTSATAPFDLDRWEPTGTAADPGLEVIPYYGAPTRQWGYDVGLQYAPAGPVARRFVTLSNVRSEYYRELPLDDDYILKLRCATPPLSSEQFDPSASCS